MICNPPALRRGSICASPPARRVLSGVGWVVQALHPPSSELYADKLTRLLEPSMLGLRAEGSREENQQMNEGLRTQIIPPAQCSPILNHPLRRFAIVYLLSKAGIKKLAIKFLFNYRLVAIIWAACWRLVSVTVAPESMRATSWVRARSSRSVTLVLVRPSASRLSMRKCWSAKAAISGK